MSEKVKRIRDDSGRLRIQIKQRLSSFSDPLKYKIVSDEEINLTTAKAYEFLELNEFAGERGVRQHHVQFLYDELIANRFLWHNVNLAMARLGKEEKYYRINGQHTCWMRVSVPSKLEPIKAICTMRVYEVENDEQLRNLYACFDRGAPRSSPHVTQVLLLGAECADGLVPTVLRLMVPGFRIFWSEDWGTANVNPNDIVGIIQSSHSKLFSIVGRFMMIHYMETMDCRKAAIQGAMFATFEKNAQASDEFWSPIWSGLNLTNKQDPRFRLREFILSHCHSGSKVGFKMTAMIKISQEDLYRCCINAWNRWRRGEKMEVVRTTKEREKALA